MDKIQNQSFIFVHIDGTLVSFSTHRILKVLLKLEKRQNGVKIYISTGRPIHAYY